MQIRVRVRLMLLDIAQIVAAARAAGACQSGEVGSDGEQFGLVSVRCNSVIRQKIQILLIILLILIQKKKQG